MDSCLSLQDIHSSGRLTYYPWGYTEEFLTPDSYSLEAIGRKISFFNGHRLWAGNYPDDFLYVTYGEITDYMYAYLGVAALGLEIGDQFYQNCDQFEANVNPTNLAALMYAIKLSKQPFQIAKGPDIFNLAVSVESNTDITVTAEVSDRKLVDIPGYESFITGQQIITGCVMYIDLHPDDYMCTFQHCDDSYIFQPEIDSNTVNVKKTINGSALSPGRHVLFARAVDSQDNFGPISSTFFDIQPSSLYKVMQVARFELARPVEEAIDNRDIEGHIWKYQTAAEQTGDKYKDPQRKAYEKWGADFVSWVFKEAGHPIGYENSSSLSNPKGTGFWNIQDMMAWFDDNDKLHKPGEAGFVPHLGDVVFLSENDLVPDKVGFIETGSEGGVVLVIQGDSGVSWDGIGPINLECCISLQHYSATSSSVLALEAVWHGDYYLDKSRSFTIQGYGRVFEINRKE
ncbi:hypothetical protein ACHAW6_002776 [Cyclotella cf. meneghiniana]